MIIVLAEHRIDGQLLAACNFDLERHTRTDLEARALQLVKDAQDRRVGLLLPPAEGSVFVESFPQDNGDLIIRADWRSA